MSGYERPTDRGSSPTKVTFWACVWTPGDAHGSARISPAFGVQGELVSWIRSVRHDGDQVQAWKRASTDHDFHDEALTTRDDPLPDPERLHALVEELKASIASRAKQLKKPEVSAGFKQRAS